MTAPEDRSGSRAVLIGVSRYVHPDLSDIPAAAANLHDLQQALTISPNSIFDVEHCTVFQDPSDIGDAVHRGARDAENVLLVYFSGHGLLDSAGRLHLATRCSDPENARWTAVAFTKVREEILDSRASTRVLILDCCFSGRAFEAMGDSDQVIAGQTDIDGTYTIVSSGANETSLAPNGHRNTAFTSALLTTASADLTLDEVFAQTEKLLRSRGHPEPRRRTTDSAGNLRLFGNLLSHAALDSAEGKRREKLQQAADTGDCQAMLELGRLLHQSGDLTGARTWTRRAAYGAAAGAAHALGNVFLDLGRIDEAERWFLSGATAGDREAMTAMGSLLLAERDDPDRAEHWFRRAAQNGATAAMVELGWLVKDLRNDLDQAEHWFRLAAADGSVPATAGLGWTLWDQKNIGAAETEFRRAATQANTSAMVGLGYLLREQKREIGEAEHWFRQGADAGDIAAMAGLAWLLQEERDDLDEAERWFRRAAQAGDRDALIGLAHLLHSIGMFDESEHWFRRAADSGDAGAMGGLGWLLQDRERLADAEHWFRGALEHGNETVIDSLVSLLERVGKTHDAELIRRTRDKTQQTRNGSTPAARA
ncbi:caspase, EACC1-associated type [Nocardia takedensis]|uniref:caspase, EACC1-associated type n=1 Tax=Nocardia takedensis TaxID=259390 RepID=UPI003F758C21